MRNVKYKLSLVVNRDSLFSISCSAEELEAARIDVLERMKLEEHRAFFAKEKEALLRWERLATPWFGGTSDGGKGKQ